MKKMVTVIAAIEIMMIINLKMVIIAKLFYGQNIKAFKSIHLI